MDATTLAGALETCRSRAALETIRARILDAWAAGELAQEAAEHVDTAIVARMAELASPRPAPPRPAGRRRPSPRSHDRAASLARRRRVAAAGWMPPDLAAHFTPGQVAALSIVAAAVEASGRCELVLDAIAARAGVSRRTVQTAIRRAAELGLVLVEESRRPRSWFSNPHRIRIASAAWRAWLRVGRTRRVQFPADHETEVHLMMPGELDGRARRLAGEGRPTVIPLAAAQRRGRPRIA